MKTEYSLRDLLLYPETAEELRKLRETGWQSLQFESQVTNIAGKDYRLRTPLTFTPYANPAPCNAHCSFCSEQLQRKNQSHLSSQKVIKNFDRYFESLAKVLSDLKDVDNLGLSLSGLEATRNKEWLLRLIALLKGDNTPRFNEKVLYTNSSGLFECTELIHEIKAAAFDRLEISRLHFDDVINNSVMRFNTDVEIQKNTLFEPLIQSLRKNITVRLSCLMTKETISSLPMIESYLNWVKSMGVTQVVFREMSQLDESYVSNSTKQWIDSNRVSLKNILHETDNSKKWHYQKSHYGYYYYNEHFLYDGIEVTLETSSYPELIKHNHESMIHKLVFHSNGNLCADWDPDNKVIRNYYEL